MKKIVAALLLLTVAFSMISCKDEEKDNESSFESADISNLDFEFTERDKSAEFDEYSSTKIVLNGTEASISGKGAKADTDKILITDAGTYVLSGSYSGMIEVRAEKTDKIQLVFNGVTAENPSGPALLVAVADKVFITLNESSENTLSDASDYSIEEDGTSVDAALFSKEDLTINGKGKLIVKGNFKHGIVSKDDLVISGGNIEVDSKNVALCGKDAVKICDSNITLKAGSDGIRAENSDDTSLGYVYIESGELFITSENDAVQASSIVKISGGNMSLSTGGGSANASTTENGSSNPSWGFGGGGPGGRPGQGGFPGSSSDGSLSSSTAESAKGIKAVSDIIIDGGSFSIDSADDSVHSNASININSGKFDICSGDDGMHADSALTISNGTISITKSYEGLEATELFIKGADINIKASDDGLNAAGGNDSSAITNRPGQNNFSKSTGVINISGGTLYINASGDGIDANGSLKISGGQVTVCGPTNGDTAVLDYDNEGIITGGTFIGTGAYMMAQTFSDSEQGVIALSVGSQSAGTIITIEDEDGNVIVTYEPALSYQIVIISTSEMKKGEEYKVTIGSYTDTFEAS